MKQIICCILFIVLALGSVNIRTQLDKVANDYLDENSMPGALKPGVYGQGYVSFTNVLKIAEGDEEEFGQLAGTLLADYEVTTAKSLFKLTTRFLKPNAIGAINWLNVEGLPLVHTSLLNCAGVSTITTVYARVKQFIYKPMLVEKGQSNSLFLVACFGTLTNPLLCTAATSFALGFNTANDQRAGQLNFTNPAPSARKTLEGLKIFRETGDGIYVDQDGIEFMEGIRASIGDLGYPVKCTAGNAAYIDYATPCRIINLGFGNSYCNSTSAFPDITAYGSINNYLQRLDATVAAERLFQYVEEVHVITEIVKPSQYNQTN